MNWIRSMSFVELTVVEERVELSLFSVGIKVCCSSLGFEQGKGIKDQS